MVAISKILDASGNDHNDFPNEVDGFLPSVDLDFPRIQIVFIQLSVELGFPECPNIPQTLPGLSDWTKFDSKIKHTSSANTSKFDTP